MNSGGGGMEDDGGVERRRAGVLVLSVWREAAPPGHQEGVRYRVLCDPALTDLAPTHWLATSDEVIVAVRQWLRTVG